MPVIIDKFLHLNNGDGLPPVEKRYIGRYGMSPKIVVVHVQQGTNWGSYEHFHNVQASATVLIGKNGDIWRLVPEKDAPWTNGDVNAPTALGREIINKWGADPNIYTLSIECEGYTDSMALTGPQMDSVVWQVATWQKQYGIDDHYVIRHADINQVDRPYCPNPNFFAEVKRRLTGEVVNVPPVYAEPSVVMTTSGPWQGVHDVTVNGAVFHADKRSVTTNVDGLRQRLYAATTSAETGEPLPINTTFDVFGWVNGETADGENRWWIADDYSRIWSGGTAQKPEVHADEEKPDVLPSGVKIVNGHVYYPAREEGKTRQLTTIGKANLRLEPSMASKVVGTVERGQDLLVRYWTIGELVKDEAIWYLTYDKGVDPFKNPKHIWAASTNERPQ